MGKLLINEPPLQVLPTLARLIGLNEALFLQQLHYWLGRSRHERDGRRWTYGTYNDWLPQFPFWSLSTIKRTVRNLEKRRLVISEQFEKRDWIRKKWYTIDYDTLALIEGTDQPALNEEVRLTPSSGSNRPVRIARNAPVMKEQVPSTETSSETTHTQRTELVSVGSKFSKDICREYADHLYRTRQGVKNPGGFATAIFRSGEEDNQIALWLEAEEAKDPAAPYGAIIRCPVCEKTEPCGEELCDFPVEKLSKDTA